MTPNRMNPTTSYQEFLKGLLHNIEEVEEVARHDPTLDHIIERILELDTAWWIRLPEARNAWLLSLADRLKWNPQKITEMQQEAKRKAKRK